MKRYPWIPSTLVFAVLLLSGPLATAQDLDPAEPVSSGDKGFFELSAEEIEAYWTPERMRAAVPYPLPELSEAEAGKLAEKLEQPEGRFEIAAGGYPLEERHKDRLTAQSMLTVEELERELGSTAEKGYSYPPPFTRLEIFTSYNRYPYRAVGKVFFRDRTDGRDYVCSGASAGGRTVWTAGHCVHSGGSNGQWHANWVFVPAYKDGRAPYGRWSAQEQWSVRGWTQNRRFSYDLGMVVTRDRRGRKLADRVGWLGSMFNASRKQHWDGFGYPGRFNRGRRLYVCQASHARNRAMIGPDPIGIGCDQLGGSSGGPWVVRLDGRAGAYNFVNGVFSFHIRGRERQQYSPYFGSTAKNLFDTVRNR